MTLRGNHPDELISASVTGDLTDAERAELDAHLARCERCRATLAAFKAERRILSGLPVAGPPRDLSARVRSGIESGRLGAPWWRGPRGLIALVASAATVAAAVLAIVVLGNLPPGPVGEQSGSPQATLSVAPSSSGLESNPPSAEQTTPPLLISLRPGELGYLELSGAPFEPSQLTFINDATGASINAGTVSGPPLTASLSPDGKWLAYTTQKGETGATEVWALSLADGEAIHLGCSIAAPFTDRLAWSPDSLFLAYTLVAVDLGPSAGCVVPTGVSGSVDVWAWGVGEDTPEQFTETGDAYAASFWPTISGTRGFPLYISHAASQPWSEFVSLYGVTYDQEPVRGVFLPLLSPDGDRALFWSGTMSSSGGGWQFSLGGLPQLAGDPDAADADSRWAGTPLFSDLVPVGGEAFAYGSFAWGLDSDRIAFWNGAWTGAPQGQSADGPYPSQAEGYIGSISGGLLSASSQRAGGSDLRNIVDITFGPAGETARTVGFPSAGIGDPPSADLEIVAACCGGEARVIGGGVDPPPWVGPAVYGR